MPSTSKKYSPEVRERAVRMVLEHQPGYGSQWAAIVSIGEGRVHAEVAYLAPVQAGGSGAA